MQLLERARNAHRLFANQGPREERRLLNFVLSNCTWEDGQVVAAFRHPFNLLAETAMSAAHAAMDETVKTAITGISAEGTNFFSERHRCIIDRRRTEP